MAVETFPYIYLGEGNPATSILLTLVDQEGKIYLSRRSKTRIRMVKPEKNHHHHRPEWDY
jgi:hypothetical protein